MKFQDLNSKNMKGREFKGPPSTDLLVCFPSRAHHYMPKATCSPASHHLRKCNTRGIGPAGQASPLICSKSKRTEISEPTSPKVTCAGQIKVTRHKPKTCKNWQSVMEEIEKLHTNKMHKRKKHANWMQYLTCLRTIKFDFRCFGSIPTAAITDVITSDDEVEEDDEEFQENEVSRTVFSKWYMVLQENQKTEFTKTEETEKQKCSSNDHVPCAPPPNALLLMRCRSAPVKNWLEEKQEQQEERIENEELAMEELESKKKKKSLVVMKYGSDLYKYSSNIAKETWVVGGIRNPFSRSRSSKR